MVRTGAVIAAAGMSTRMGDFKPLLKMGGIPIIERIIINFQQAGVFPIVVVTGYRAKELEKYISKLGVICVRNNEFETTEMFDSAKIGFSFVEDKCDRVFFTPTDIPLFSYNTVVQMMESEAEVVKPVCDGMDGHPILLSTKLLPKIYENGSREGLKRAIALCTSELELIAVDDEGILHDADTPQEYKELIDERTRELYRPVLDVSLVKEGKLFDKNCAMLLHMIDYMGNVKNACEKVGMSYSQAWKTLNLMEDNLGFQLIERVPGGESGGSSYVTMEGKRLLKNYEKYVSEVKEYANAVFDKYMK